MKKIIRIITPFLLGGLLFSCQKTECYEPLYDAPTFTNLVSGTTERLTRVQFVNKNIGYVSGRTGTILATKDAGATWQKQTLATVEHIQGVSFVDENTGWLTGAKGILFNTTDGGTTWNKQTLTTTTQTMNSVNFVDKNNGWIVGALGLIYHTSDGGANWQQQTNFDTLGMKAGTITNILANGGTVAITSGNIANTTLNHIYAEDNNTLYILANNGIMLKTTDAGATWKWQNTGTNNSLYGISFSSPNLAFICGANGTILKTDGNGSFQNATNKANTRSFRDIFFSTDINGWAIGEHGYIFKTTTGGAYWGNEMSFESIYILYACAFTKPDVGYFVGNNGTIIKVQDIEY